MKFCYATITVKNLEESLRFYKDIVGLTETRRFLSSTGNEIAFLGEGETQVELIYNPKKNDIMIGLDISLGFEVESVAAKMKEIQAKGISIHSGPFQPNPQIKFFYIQDPNGLRIQFAEHM